MTIHPSSVVERFLLAVEALGQDVVHAARHLRQSPGVAAASVVILSLVITTCATLLSVTHALVFSPLPVANPGRLAAVSFTDTEIGGVRLTTYQTFRRFIDAQTVLTGAFAFRGSGLLPVQVGDRLSDGVIAGVTPEAFTTLGLMPAYGRFFTAQEAPATAEPERIIVISDRLWRQLFDARPEAVGETLVVRGRPLTVIGVMPASFPGLAPHTGSDLYVPLTLIPHLLEASTTGAPNPRLTHIVGHLREHVTLEQARAATTTLWPSLQESSASNTSTERVQVTMAGGGFSALRTEVERPLVMLLGLAAALVLIGTVNLYGLMSVRSAAREGQMAIRLALGAPRRRLLRVLTIESVLLAVVVALIVVVLTPPLSTMAGALLWQGNVPLLTPVTPGAPLMVAICLAVLVACLAVGVLPALPSIAAAPAGALQKRRASPPATSWRAGTVIVAQVGLSVVLVATAGLFAGSLMHLRAIDTGFRPTSLVFGRAWQLPGLDRTYDEQSHYPALTSRLEALPGVESVAMAFYFPGYLGFTGIPLDGVGHAGVVDRDADVGSLLEFISPRFFDTVGSSILRGRDFTWSDRLGTAPVVMINETLERHLFPDGGAIGAYIRVGTDTTRQRLEVIGVSADVTVGNLRSPHLPTVFRPRMQEATRQRLPTLLMKTDLDAGSLIDPVDTILRDMGHEHVRTLMTIDEQLDVTLRQERLLAGVGSTFAAAALLVTLVGLHALLAQTVTRRTWEIGVRMALGASRLHVVGSVTRQAVWLTIIGIAVGLPTALVVGRLAESLLFGVAPGDPSLLAGSAVAFIVVAHLAALLPALRASRIDPVVALKGDTVR